MAHDGIGQLDGVMALEAKPDSEIHVLAIAEEFGIEATNALENLAAVDGGGGAGRQHFSLALLTMDRLAESAAPEDAARVVDVPRAIELRGARRINLQRAESSRAGIAGDSQHDLLQPIGLRERIRVQRRDPVDGQIE